MRNTNLDANFRKDDAIRKIITNASQTLKMAVNKVPKFTANILTVLLFLMIGAINIYSAPPYSSTNPLQAGTEQNPWEICNLSDWNLFAADVNNPIYQGFPGVYFKLMANLGSENPADRVTVMAGSNPTPFKGHFDGNGKTVWVDIHSDNLLSGQTTWMGLFCVLENATVKDLTVKGEVTNNDAYCAAGIAAHARGITTIHNCKNYAKITAHSIGGGIVAEIDGGNVTLSNCYNYNSVTALEVAGGIIGEIGGYQTVILDGCHNHGIVSDGKSGGIIGGIIGKIVAGQSVNISNSTNNQAVSGLWAGGFVGEVISNSGTVSFYNSVNNIGGKVEATNEAGGFVGKVSNGSVYFLSCYNKGSVKSVRTGGFIGDVVTGTITFTDCQNSSTATITGVTTGGFIGNVWAGSITFAGCQNNGSVNSNTTSGGFIGNVATGTATFAGCQNNGSIGTNTTTTSGGFIGNVATGNIIFNSCQSNGSVVGVTVGGFVGSMQGGTLAFSNSNNNGSVVGDVAGGLVGNSSGSTTVSATNSYNKGTLIGTVAASGFLPKLIVVNNSITLINFKNYGTIISGGEKLGGIIGSIEGLGTSPILNANISNCHNYGDVIGFGATRIGGIVGSIKDVRFPTFSKCENYGRVISGHYNPADILDKNTLKLFLAHNKIFPAPNRDTIYIGGILGFAIIHSNDTTKFLNCINNGSLISNGTASAGGILGYGGGDAGRVLIQNCMNGGSVILEGGSPIAAAGIMADCFSYSNHGAVNMTILIFNCVNIGKILANGALYSSGIVAYIKVGVLEYNVNSGIVAGGGVVGGIAGFVDDVNTGPVEISNCINTNWVEGSAIVGTHVATNTIISNNFYDKQMTIIGGISGVDIQGKADGLITDRMTSGYLQGRLQGNWTFYPNLYPAISNHTIGLLASAAIYLYNPENVSDVKTAPFGLSNVSNSFHPFVWGKYDDKTTPGFLNYIATSTNGNIDLFNASMVVDNGWDTLSVRLVDGGMPTSPLPLEAPDNLVFEKAVPMNLNALIYNIYASLSGCGGDILKQGSSNVLVGTDKTFTIYVKQCGVIKTLLIDGIPDTTGLTYIGPAETSPKESKYEYTFKNVQANHTIHIEFEYVYPDGVTVYRKHPYDSINSPRNPCNYSSYERTNSDTVVFEINMPSYFPDTIRLSNADIVLYNGNGTVKKVEQHAQYSNKYYVTVLTDTDSLGNPLGYSCSDIMDIIIMIDAVYGIPVNACYQEWYYVRKAFWPNLLIDPINNSTVSIHNSTGTISFGCEITGSKFVKLNTDAYPDFPPNAVAVVDAVDGSSVSCFDAEFISGNGNIYYSFCNLQPNASYNIYLSLPDSIFIDEWGNYNTAFNDSLIGSFQTGFYKIGAENDASTTSSSGGFTISNIYPNPTTNEAEFTVNVLEEGSLNVAIYDLSGSFVMQIISDKFMNANTELRVPLTLGMLSSGTYTVVVSMSNNKSAKQVIIVK